MTATDMTPILHKYVDGLGGCFANMTFPSGERVLLSVAAKGLAVFRLYLLGLVPGRQLFSATSEDTLRVVRVLTRDLDRLPALPQARELHRDDGAMASLLDAAIADLDDVAECRPIGGAVEDFDTDNPPPRPLAILTRAALGCAGAEAYVTRLERARNTPA